MFQVLDRALSLPRNFRASGNKITELNSDQKKTVYAIIMAVENNTSNNEINCYSNLVGFLNGDIALENLGVNPNFVNLIKEDKAQYFNTAFKSNTFLKKDLVAYFKERILQNNSPSLFNNNQNDKDIIEKIKQLVNISDTPIRKAAPLRHSAYFSNNSFNSSGEQKKLGQKPGNQTSTSTYTNSKSAANRSNELQKDNFEAKTNFNQEIDEIIEIATSYINPYQTNNDIINCNLLIEDFTFQVHTLSLPDNVKLSLIEEFNNIIQHPSSDSKTLLKMLTDSKNFNVLTVLEGAEAKLSPVAKKEDIIKTNPLLGKICNILGIENPSLEINNQITDQKLAFKQYLFNHFLDNEAKAKLNIPKLANILNFEEVFKEKTGISFAQFMGIIYGAPTVQMKFASASSIRPSTTLYVNETVIQNNQNEMLTQLIKINDELSVFTEIKGYTTFSSNSQGLDKDLFTTYPDVLGINHNSRITKILTDDNCLTEYNLHTVGSYQIDTPDSVANASKLLKTFSSPGDIVVDFKPLKRLYPGDHDSIVFETHTSVINKAAGENNTTYLPVWGNSHAIPLRSSPESNNQFDKIMEELADKLLSMSAQNQAKLRPLLTKLSSLAANLDNFTKRGTFRLIFSLTRILVANIPGHSIKLIGGCMSAKDRMQSLTYASEVIITMYHKKGNLDFIDDDGRFVKEKLEPEDIILLKVLINNKIGQNYLSQMGIGVLNNKNLDLFANLFANIPELYNMIDQNSYVKTSA